MILSRLSSSLIPWAYGLIFRDGFRNLLLILTCCLPSACSMNGQSQRVEPVDAATTLTLKKSLLSGRLTIWKSISQVSWMGRPWSGGPTVRGPWCARQPFPEMWIFAGVRTGMNPGRRFTISLGMFLLVSLRFIIDSRTIEPAQEPSKGGLRSLVF